MKDEELDQVLQGWKAPEAPASMRAGLREKLAAGRPRRVLPVRLRWVAAFAAAATVAIGASLVERNAIGSDAGSWDALTYVRRTRMVEPALAKFKWGLMGGRSTGWQMLAGRLEGSVYLYNRWNGEHYGYTWNAQPLGHSRFLFTVLPLDPSAIKEAGRVVMLPPVPPRLIAPGAPIEVDLYRSGTERVFDRIELSNLPLRLEVERDAAETARTITLREPRLYINGQQVLDKGGVEEVSGATITVDVAGRGRYTLALDARGNSRFVEAGVAEGNVIDFVVGGERWRVASTAPVATGGRRPVFVYRQENTAAAAGFGGGGSPEQYR